MIFVTVGYLNSLSLYRIVLSNTLKRTIFMPKEEIVRAMV